MRKNRIIRFLESNAQNIALAIHVLDISTFLETSWRLEKKGIISIDVEMIQFLAKTLREFPLVAANKIDKTDKKAFCIIFSINVLHNSLKAIQNWEVVTSIKEDNTKKVSIEAYLKVVDYYARKYANDFTSKAAARAKKKGIAFKSKYFEIGAFFKPNNEHHGDICHKGTKEETHLSTPGFGESPLPTHTEKVD